MATRWLVLLLTLALLGCGQLGPKAGTEVGPKAGTEAGSLLLTSPQIQAYQRLLVAGSKGSLVDLSTHPATLDRATLTGLLQAWVPEVPTLYQRGQALTPADLTAALQPLNLAAVGDDNAVQWGVTVRTTNVRLRPQAEGWFETPTDVHFDLLQGSVLDPGEALALLHLSADGQWWFGRAVHSHGWVRAADVALASKERCLELASPKDPLVVTVPLLSLRVTPPAGQPVDLDYRMGAALTPWPDQAPATTPGDRDFRVAVPWRNEAGGLVLLPSTLPPQAPLHHGYLSYTSQNVLDLAHKFVGQPYGWGGLGGGVDCSYLVALVYRCFGLILPRNSGYQELLPARDWTLGAPTWDDLDRALAQVPAGASLHLKGHVMIYLGKQAGRHQVLHAMAARGDGPGVTLGGRALGPDDPALLTSLRPRRLEVMQVVVTDLDLLRPSGASLGLSLTRAKVFVPPAAGAAN
jgi:hypothetical protein